MTRRELCKILLLGGVAPSFIPFLDDDAKAARLKPLCTGRLTFCNVHTDESMAIRYLNRRGQVDREALARLNRLFRCSYDGTMHRIDPRLFLLLDAVRTRLRVNHRPYLLLSGYRSPTYNNYLFEHYPGVAKHSYHIKGMAADIRIDGVPLHEIHRVAYELRAGGIGSYPDFVHLDVGPVRYWRF